MRVVGYIRVSTDEQGKEGVSLPNQDEKVRGYCALYNLDLAGIESDPGVSAKTLDRPGLRAALDRLRSPRSGVEGLVIFKLDRLTRSIGDWDRLIKDLFNERIGKQLFSVSDQIDTRTANGRFFLNLMILVAQWERETIVERTADALQGKIRRRERTGKVRFGYDLADDGRTLVANEREQEAIGLMRRLREPGDSKRSYRDLAELLNREGIPTKEGGRWHASTVRQILTRRTA